MPTTAEKKSASKKPATTEVQKPKSKPGFQRQAHQIDATNQVLGRLASSIAILLRGKHRPTFTPHLDQGDFVVVRNAKNLKITGNKREQKIYYHHSGYPGGLKRTQMKDVIAKNPGDVLRRAVWNMLPKNKLRSRMIKRLTIIN
ncbi:MAG: 50S ribosomal protein L13 [Candidatus Buchananbacteria bacterium RIFCSPLOWO2_01_FULL_56_15]|uniref:Large ribosomal subunit protein uL13 n=2 Tax=Candidatus Buchananiibacteriota TaxID=1817903 RepID=A0A1G1YGN7_9BACT|nr:MAG: 50S ribosomal protein L13 [Candidatus Buchananbacteria bacterium RIFCSPHIGHO2_02_FULL_56_16]OGY55004.1 MAG: 50S ribosomal protein L13 [Candidatus Buchananbacteria bacterium RIFCSPLOWO2_01_FULL_56_15]